MVSNDWSKLLQSSGSRPRYEPELGSEVVITHPSGVVQRMDAKHLAKLYDGAAQDFLRVSEYMEILEGYLEGIK